MRLALLACALAALRAASPATLRGSAVFDALRSSPLAASDALALPPVDREFAYPADFALDKPFQVRVEPRESLLLPLEPIRSKLFSQDDAEIAIGFEFSTCQGKVLTTILMLDGHSHQFSSADYQCATLSKRADKRMGLCSIARSDQNVPMRRDPTKVKGFILRAHFAEPAEVVAVLRSTKDKGEFNKAFFVDSNAQEDELARKLNVSFSVDSTQLMFRLAHTWETSVANQTCSGCEYTLYAEMAPPSNSSGSLPERPPPPYCARRAAAVSYKLPATSSTSSQHITLKTGFADLFSTSGNYRFVLVASLPTSGNKGREAMLSYAPTHVSITAPPHYTSHIISILTLIAAVTLLFAVALKSDLFRRLSRSADKSHDEPHDDESVRLLAQVIADQDAQDALEQEDEAEGRKSEALLDVIRRKKAQETPTPSPRHATNGAHLEGYHEIN